ncbi:MAG: hypothetical protein OQL20_05415 [Sedimenticola sp.]|nr:hypothetical protein [Sedimenticola sp.]
MPNQKYQLVFSGKLLEGFKHPEVKLSLAQLLKIPLDQAGHLIQGDRYRIKKPLEKEKAERLLEKILQRGAECRVEPVKLKVSKPQTDQAQSDATPGGTEPADDAQVMGEQASALTLDLPGSSDAPLSLDLPELTPEDDQTRPMATVQPEGDEIVMASPADVAKFKPEDDSGNVGTFYERGDSGQQKTSDETKSAAKQKQLIMALGALIIVALAAWILAPMVMDLEPEPVVNTAPVVPVDPKRAQSIARLEQLNRSVNVWMIQYGSGFNPTQVTLERLQQDLGMSDKDMMDGWGTALRFEPEAQLYRVISAGPDKSFGTGDDLKRETTTIAK